MKPYIGADGRTYEMIGNRRYRDYLDWRGTGRDIGETVIELGATVGALVAGIAMIIACLAFGPIGWLAGIFLVPIAFMAGYALGAIALPLLLGLFALVWLAHFIP